MKKVLAGILTATMLTTILAGCSKTPDNASSSENKKVELKVVTQFGGDDANTQLFIDMIKEWEGKSGHKVINDSAKADNVWKSRVITDFNAGGEPDVLFFFNGAVVEPILDKVVDVETIQKEDADYGKNIRPSVLKAANNLNKKGKPVSLPIKGFAEGLFCNKEIFKQAGAEIPKDWNSLMTAIEKIKAIGKIPMTVSLGGEPHYYFDHLIMAVGGDKSMAVNPKSDSQVPDSWKKGLGLLKELYDAGAFPKDTASIGGEESRTYFRNGEAAMYLDGSWFGMPADGTKDAKVTDKDVQVVPFPSYKTTENKAGTILSGFSSGWYITEKCWKDKEKRAAAIDFIKYNTNDEAIARYMTASGGFSASDTVKIDESKITGLQKQFITLLKNAPSTPMVAQDNLAKEAFQIYLSSALDLAKGTKTADEVIKSLVSANK